MLSVKCLRSVGSVLKQLVVKLNYSNTRIQDKQTIYRASFWQSREIKTNVTHLNDSGHLLREDVKQFDLGWDARAVLSVSEQSKSASRAKRSFNRP